VTLTQAPPASGTVTAGTAFTAQLAVTGATGAVTYTTTTSPPGPVTVSPAGALTAPAATPAGVYQLAGTDTDPLGDTGTWAFTLSVTTPGSARADLSLTLHAPARASAGGGTLTGRQLLTFTASTVPAGSTVTYHVTLTPPARARGRAVLAAATASLTRDPSYRNNAALALTQVH
jgi:hypothetical protein